MAAVCRPGLARAAALLATSSALLLAAFPGHAAEALLPTSAAGAPSAPDTRDPLSWPFARDSIWNTPIGSDAKYVPAGISAAHGWRGAVTADPELISLDPTAAVRTLDAHGQAGHGAKVRVGADVSHDGSWNGCSTLLTEDGTGVWSGQPLRMDDGGNPTWTYTTQSSVVDLRGPGVEGCHGGSGMSGLGGSLRPGELASQAPLRHALKVNLHCARYCYRGASQSDSKRWPALTADQYWSRGYGGELPALRMGALLAVPPQADLSGVTDPKALKIALAMRDYGAYLVDDTAWDVHAIAMDRRLVDSGEWPAADVTGFHRQLQHVFSLLAVVDNNSAASPGGGGAPRAPLAPCFHDDAPCLRGAAATTRQEPDDEHLVAGRDPVAVSLTELDPVRASNGWGPYEVDRSNGEERGNDGAALTVQGRTHPRGLGVHAPSRLTYALDHGHEQFRASVGVDDEVGSRGSVVFEVRLDGRLAWRSPRLTGEDDPVRVQLPLRGVEQLELVVTDGGDGASHDHADWGDARLTRSVRDAAVRPPAGAWQENWPRNLVE